MADVTISQLTRGTPTGNSLLPYSTGSNTLGVPVSALLQNTNNVGIGVNAFVYGNNVVLRGFDSPTFIGSQPLGLGILNGGNYDLAGIDFKNFAGNSLAGRIGVEITGGGGFMKLGTSNNYASGITNTALIIDPNGAVTKPKQPAFAVRAVYKQYGPGISNPFIDTFENIQNISNSSFNLNTGIYTAPAGGIYAISGMIRLDPCPTSYIYPRFYINNQDYYNISGGALPGLNIFESANNPFFGTSNFSILIKINANDTLRFSYYVPDNTSFAVYGQTCFYGYLLG